MNKISAAWQERLLTPPKGWCTDSFQNTQGEKLHYALSLPDGKIRGHVMYVQGLNEFTEKTYELARDFNRHALGFSVFDRLGQGRSPRLLDHHYKVHSQGAEKDINDIITFAESIVPYSRKITMLGHSTGGLLGLMAYHKRPDLFTPPVLSAPLLGINKALIKGREFILAALYLPDKIRECYVPNGTDWRPRGQAGLPPPEAYSSHPQRMKIQDELTRLHPELRAGDPTIGWVQDFCRAIVQARSKKWLKQVGPVTIFTAGNDQTVNNQPVFKALAAMPKASHFHFADSKHEMPFETDNIRKALIDRTVQNALNP